MSHSAKKMSFDISEIQKIIPHRYPLLLIDRIDELVQGKSVKATKNVTINDQFFQGHFPGQPVMPGVMILESMAQAGGFLVLYSVENPEKKMMYLSKIESARFKQIVIPGDKLELELNLLKFRLNTCKIEGKAFVNGKVVAEVVFIASIVDREVNE